MKRFLPSYADWAATSQKQRHARLGAPSSRLSFSVLTTIYERTDAVLFRLTIDSMLNQTLPFHEWIVLAHGPISVEVDFAVAELGQRDDVRLLRLPDNLGIIGGMRICLDAATGEYLVPIDADDLLTSDALQLLADFCENKGHPALVYTDEDILVENIRCTPYWRPDWDPVLNLSSSFIWHLCCLRRDIALLVDLYSDSAANWCHDWDSVFRIVQAGHQPVHMPEVVYHWRQHPVSSTNRVTPESGSRQSTYSLLKRFLATRAKPDLYLIEDFPVFRGAPEWTITRKPVGAPDVALLLFSEGHEPDEELSDERPWRYSATITLPTPPRPTWKWRLWLEHGPAVSRTIAPLKTALATVQEPVTVVRSQRIAPKGEGWFWEAVKLLELHGDVKLVHGLIADQNDRVRRGGEVFLKTGQLVCPQRGKPLTDPGPFALALKPHCVSSVPTDFFIADTGFLRDALERLPDDTPLAGLGIRLSAVARSAGFLTAFSPLIVARMTGALLDGEPQDLSNLAETVLGRDECRRAGRTVCGQAGFLNHAGDYR